MRSSVQVAIRTDASAAIGAGHLMRCLTLAECLRESGAEVYFVCRAGVGDGIDLVLERGFIAYPLDGPADPETDAKLSAQAIRTSLDWIVVDHYGLDHCWESPMRKIARNVLVIDDLADRNHDCDLLLDQNFYTAAGTRYRDRVPTTCRLLLGPAFALLRKEFRESIGQPRQRNGQINRILVTFGATDPSNETSKVLRALGSLASTGVEVDVVVGNANPLKDSIANKCAAIPGVRCHVQTSRMATLMQAADIAIGAGGSTMWERCALGLPSITVITAANQHRTTCDLAATGAIWYLGNAENLTDTDYGTAIREAMGNTARLMQLSALSRAVMQDESINKDPDRHPVVTAMLGALQHA